MNFYDYCGSGRILVVDDSAATRDLVALRLGVAGYNVQTVENGARALARLDSFRPDGVICDIHMPEVDGLEFLQRLGPVRLKSLPVMMLSARQSASEVERAIFYGARDYLLKPFDDRMLLRRVARLVRKREPLRRAA